MTERLAKIRFELDVSDWHGHGSETLWAKPVAENERGIFQIRNSPFFAKGINNLDVVLATPTEDDLVFDFVRIIQHMGHSTYMILMQPDEDARIAAYWSLLEGLGCSHESMHIDLSIGRRILYSVDVPPTADLHKVYEILERGHQQGVWIFQEGYASISDSRSNSRQT